MKNYKTILTAVAITSAAFLMACDRNDDNMGDNDSKVEMEVSWKNLTDSVNDTFDKVADYSAEQKDAFVKELNETGKIIDQTMYDLSQDMEQAANNTSDAFNDEWADVKDARTELNQAMQNAQNATAEGWDEATDEVDAAWDNFKNEWNEALQSMKTDA